MTDSVYNRSSRLDLGYDNPFGSKAPVMGVSRHRVMTDGDGVASLVCFFVCPLSCRFCLNPLCKDTDYEEFRIIDAAKLYEYVQMDDLYFRMSGGGITFGGGEPLCHSAFITAFHELCKDDGWNLRVETSLNVSEASVKAVTPFIHEFIVDIKDMNPAIYKDYTGMDNSLVVKNLRYLVAQGAADRVLVRIPSIDGFNTEDDIQKSKEELLRMGLHRFDLFTYETSLEAAYSKTVSGKSICHYLKSLRQAAADQNGIAYEPAECHYEGECSGTCPKCEEELKTLTEQLKRLSTTRTSKPRCGGWRMSDIKNNIL